MYACCASRVFLGLVSLQRKFEIPVVGVAVLVPIVVDGFVLQVEIAAFGVVVIGNDIDVVVVVGQVLLLLRLVGVFRLLELIWLKAAQMQVLGQLLVVSSAEVLVAVLLCGMSRL